MKMKQKMNKMTVTVDEGDEKGEIQDSFCSLIGKGEYKEGDRTSFSGGVTLKGKESYSFNRIGVGISALIKDEDDIEKIEVIVNKLLEREAREYIAGKKGKTIKLEDVSKITEPLNGMESRSLYFSCGATIPMGNYQARKFDVSLNVYIDDKKDFSEVFETIKEEVTKGYIQQRKLLLKAKNE